LSREPDGAEQSTPAVLSDVGDVPLRDGHRIRRGRAYRISGQILTPTQLDALRMAGVRVVVDMRGYDEDRTVMRQWAESAGITYQHEPIPAASGSQLLALIRAGIGPKEAAGRMEDTYRWIVDECGPQIAATLRVLAAGEVCGFGCAAGRDRTGIVSALLQSVLGADDESVAAAYLRDAPDPARLRVQARQHLAIKEGMPLPAAVEVLLGARAEWILKTLAHVRAVHGDVRKYLAVHGIDADTVMGLAANFIDDVSLAGC
jgi:protein-tyrosine phosphatase